MSRMSWGNPRPSSNDTNGDGRLSFAEIQGRYHAREMAEQRSSKRSSGEGDRDNRDEQRRDERRGRGRSGRDENSRRDSDSSRGNSSDESGGRDSGGSKATPTTSAPSTSQLERSRSYVDNYFKDRDADKNGFLEGDELKKVNRSSKSNYDTNRDGKIGRDEMLDVVSPSSATGSSQSQSSSGGRRSSRSSSRSRSGRTSSRASGSFTEVDKNADRLVQMHEFSEKWTQKQLDEFLAKDKNGDGVISPEEW